jgi:hypothetical protein
VKALKFLLATVLWLPCAALTLTLCHYSALLGLGHGPWLERPAFWLALGFVCWLAVFSLIGPSARAYILGHELTHVFFARLMGGYTSGLRAGADGGHVKVSKENWLITLSPYFVPFYTLLLIGAYFLAGLWWNMRPFAPELFYLVGFTYSFHLLYTLVALRQSQGDVQRHGWLFSMTVIYGMNLLLAALLLALLSPHVTLAGLGHRFCSDLVLCWQWLLRGLYQMQTLWRQLNGR